MTRAARIVESYCEKDVRCNMAETAAAKGIAWRHDFDAALADAKAQSREVLADFSAAPM